MIANPQERVLPHPLSVYQDPHIRRRISDYLGGDSPDTATCAYLAHTDGCGFGAFETAAPNALSWFFENEMDIARSLQDRAGLLIHLDIEYVNFDSPAAAYLDPWKAFELQEPVINVVEERLTEWGIRPLHLITGQGHHFVWRIDIGSKLVPRLASLIDAPSSPPVANEGDEPDTDLSTRAFAGLALVMEHLAHDVRRHVSPYSFVPVEITALHVGPSTTSEREIVSIDISEYGDPLRTRVIRVPFSRYRKPWEMGIAQALGEDDAIPAMFTIPLHEMDWRQALKTRQDTADIVDLAKRSCTRIPLQEIGTENLINDYLHSDLRVFHETYAADKAALSDSPGLPWDQLPPCVRHLFEQPNDLLLKPTGMQQVTRTLMALEWSPPQIARLIASVFKNTAYHWGKQWEIYDPEMRAEFYVRLFSGLISTGADILVDFNCRSTQEKGFCFGANGCSLARFHKSLTTLTR